MVAFTTNGTFGASSRVAHPETGEAVSLAGKRDSSLIFDGSGLPFPSTVTGDDHASNKNDAMVYDLTLGGVNALRLGGFFRFELGDGDDVLDLTVRAANATTPFFLDATAIGGRGADVLWTGSGNDTLLGDAISLSAPVGNTFLASNDRLHGGPGQDVLYGDAVSLTRTDAGRDIVAGGPGDDVLYGDSETLSGSTGPFGDDTLRVGAGADVLYGDGELLASRGTGSGNDLLEGGEGADILYGDHPAFNFGIGGNDRLDGGGGNDRLYGGAGNDRLNGGAGDDELRGDTGADTFVIERGTNLDLIMDMQNSGLGTFIDRIDVSAFGIRSFGELAIINNGTQRVDVNFGSGDSVEVRNLFGGGLTLEATDFIFAP